MLQQISRTVQSKAEEVPPELAVTESDSQGTATEEDLTVNSYYLPTDKLFLILEFVWQSIDIDTQYLISQVKGLTDMVNLRLPDIGFKAHYEPH